MKRFAIALPLVLAAILAACGSSSSSNSINGNWRATLTDASGNPAFGFTTALTENGNGVSGSNLTFTTATPCFGSDATETGGFSLSGNANGVQSGGFTLSVQSGASSNGSNTLNLNGTLNNNAISGTWTLSGTGTGCTGSGNFSMVKF